VCAVGLVRVRDGWVAGKSGGLVRPPDVLIRHNATFTIGVLRNACAADGIPVPTSDFLCAMLMARMVLRLPSYRLPFVADKCGAELAGRHQVLINARGAALVAVALARQHGAGTPGELAEALGIRIGRLEPGRYVPTIRGAPRISRDRQQPWNDVATVGSSCPARLVAHSGIVSARLSGEVVHPSQLAFIINEAPILGPQLFDRIIVYSLWQSLYDDLAFIWY
jgi:DNA polymerase III epsilon subunit-like protein